MVVLVSQPLQKDARAAPLEQNICRENLRKDIAEKDIAEKVKNIIRQCPPATPPFNRNVPSMRRKPQKAAVSAARSEKAGPVDLEFQYRGTDHRLAYRLVGDPIIDAGEQAVAEETSNNVTYCALYWVAPKKHGTTQQKSACAVWQFLLIGKGTRHDRGNRHVLPTKD